MATRIGQLQSRSQPVFVVAALAIVAIVGGADYLTGHDIFFSTFYLIAVALAAWKIGPWFAVFISALSVATWIGGDVASGATYPSLFVPFWNAFITFTFYLVVVWLLTKLRRLQAELEDRVQQRTAALVSEMAERERLEGEILEISEREQQRIGHDLHDSLCQHLAATALAVRVLGEELSEASSPKAADTNKIVKLIEESINMTRTLAKGLHPLQLEADGLMSGFRELAAKTSERFEVSCLFRCEQPVMIHDTGTAIHLYRIAQEAVSNAIKHGKAKHIVIGLNHQENAVTLTIDDDGAGLPEPVPKTEGMGLRIMAYRARMIHGSFEAKRNDGGGTTVRCVLKKS